MTKAEALAEAQRRWGDSACVNKIRGTRVYEVCGGWNLQHYGSGPSWEAAFANVVEAR